MMVMVIKMMMIEIMMMVIVMTWTINNDGDGDGGWHIVEVVVLILFDDADGKMIISILTRSSGGMAERRQFSRADKP